MVSYASGATANIRVYNANNSWCHAAIPAEEVVMPSSNKYPLRPEDVRLSHPDLFHNCRTHYPQPKIGTGEHPAAPALRSALEPLIQENSRLGPIFAQMCQQGWLAALETIVAQRLTAQRVAELYHQVKGDLQQLARLMESGSVATQPTNPGRNTR
jgi:hypothetical protein